MNNLKSICIHGTILNLNINNIKLLITDPPLFNDIKIENIFSENNLTSIENENLYVDEIKKYFNQIFLKLSNDPVIVLGHLGKSFSNNKKNNNIINFFNENNFYINEIIIVNHKKGSKKWFVFKKNNIEYINEINISIEKNLKLKPTVDKFNYVGANNENTIKYIIERYTKPNDIVVDIFGGSGTVACVSKAIDRIGINIEIEKEIHEYAEFCLNDTDYLKKIATLPEKMHSINKINTKDMLFKHIDDFLT